MSRRRGVTLIELLVTLSVLAVLSGVTVLAVRRIDAPVPTDPETMIADSLRATLERGRQRVLQFDIDGQPASATLRADGSVIADSLLAVDRFTGKPTRAR